MQYRKNSPKEEKKAKAGGRRKTSEENGERTALREDWIICRSEGKSFDKTSYILMEDVVVT